MAVSGVLKMWLNDSPQLLFPVADLAAHLQTVNIYCGLTPKSTGAFSSRLCPSCQTSPL